MTELQVFLAWGDRGWVFLQNQAKSSPAQMALLGRYAAAIPLQERHRRALVQSAAAGNMAVANYG